MTRRDEHLWEEEVVEAFLDLDRAGRDYAEIEISPGNVVCDVRVLPRARVVPRPRLYRAMTTAMIDLVFAAFGPELG